MQTLEVRSARREQLIDVTDAVGEAVAALGVDEGAVLVYVPHTTAAVAVNEGYDPDVAADIERWLARAVPRDGGYAHAEGNSDSHIKAILVGPSRLLPVAGGRLRLGRWQAVFLCEFDGPRSRQLWVGRV
jgi:secondary thiamine-phosphate synthase enzyme